MMKNSFNLKSKYENIAGIKAANKHIYDCIKDVDNFDSLESLGEDKLDNIIYRSEKIALSCRNSLEKIVKEKPQNSSFYYEKPLENNPVKVDFNDNYLSIFTPFTFKRFYRDDSMKENYLLMNYVKSALYFYQKENKITLFRSLKTPLIVMIIRKGKSFNRMKICDNDNLENGRIINEIFDCLGYSDNVLQMDIFSCFRLVESDEQCGVEFLVFPADNLINHIGLFQR